MDLFKYIIDKLLEELPGGSRWSSFGCCRNFFKPFSVIF